MFIKPEVMVFNGLSVEDLIVDGVDRGAFKEKFENESGARLFGRLLGSVQTDRGFRMGGEVVVEIWRSDKGDARFGDVLD